MANPFKNLFKSKYTTFYSVDDLNEEQKKYIRDEYAKYQANPEQFDEQYGTAIVELENRLRTPDPLLSTYESIEDDTTGRGAFQQRRTVGDKRLRVAAEAKGRKKLKTSYLYGQIEDYEPKNLLTDVQSVLDQEETKNDFVEKIAVKRDNKRDRYTQLLGVDPYDSMGIAFNKWMKDNPDLVDLAIESFPEIKENSPRPYQDLFTIFEKSIEKGTLEQDFYNIEKPKPKKELPKKELVDEVPTHIPTMPISGVEFLKSLPNLDKNDRTTRAMIQEVAGGFQFNKFLKLLKDYKRNPSKENELKLNEFYSQSPTVQKDMGVDVMDWKEAAYNIYKEPENLLIFVKDMKDIKLYTEIGALMHKDRSYQKTGKNPLTDEELKKVEKFLYDEQRVKTEGAQIIEGLAQMAPFMQEFAATYGTSAILKKGTKELAYKALKEETKDWAKAILAKRGVSATTKTTAVLTKAAAMTELGFRQDAEYYRNLIPGLDITEEGMRVYTAPMSEKDARRRAKANTFIENVSEFSGPAITAGLKKLSLGAKDLLLTESFSKALSKKIKSLYPQLNITDDTLNKIRSYVRATGYDGFFEEVLEERFGEALRAALQGLSDQGIIEGFEDDFAQGLITDLVKTGNLEQFASGVRVEAGVLILPGAGTRIAAASIDYNRERKFKRDYKSIADKRDELKEKNKKTEKELKTLQNKKKLTKKDKKRKQELIEDRRLSAAIEGIEEVVKNNPKLKDQADIEIVDEIKEITAEQLEEQGTSMEEEGLPKDTKKAQVFGGTWINANSKLALELNRGADLDTAVEEYFGLIYRGGLNDSQIKAFEEYYDKYSTDIEFRTKVNQRVNELAPGSVSDVTQILSEQELFEREGKGKYFESKLEPKTFVDKIFDGIKNNFNKVFGNITLDDKIRDMYEKAGAKRVKIKAERALKLEERREKRKLEQKKKREEQEAKEQRRQDKKDSKKEKKQAKRDAKKQSKKDKKEAKRDKKREKLKPETPISEDDVIEDAEYDELEEPKPIEIGELEEPKPKKPKTKITEDDRFDDAEYDEVAEPEIEDLPDIVPPKPKEIKERKKQAKKIKSKPRVFNFLNRRARKLARKKIKTISPVAIREIKIKVEQQAPKQVMPDDPRQPLEILRDILGDEQFQELTGIYTGPIQKIETIEPRIIETLKEKFETLPYESLDFFDVIPEKKQEQILKEVEKVVGKEIIKPIRELKKPTKPKPKVSEDESFDDAEYDDVPKPKLDKLPKMKQPKKKRPSYQISAKRAYKYLPKDKKKQEDRLRKSINRDESVAQPKNPPIVFENDDYRITIGNKSFEDWVKDTEKNLNPDEIEEAANWYGDVYDEIANVVPRKDVEKVFMSWLIAQKQESPIGAFGGTLKVKEEVELDIRRTKPKTGDYLKSGGLSDENMRRIFRDIPIEGGVGAKLLDFVDSAINSPTRFVVGNKPEGGAPYVVDRHTWNGRGYVSPVFLRYMEKAFGAEKLKNLELDNTKDDKPSDTQYDQTSIWGNKLTEYLNSINWRGKNNWTAPQIQAIDWTSIVKFKANYGKVGGTIQDAIKENTAVINFETVFGENTSYEKDYPEIKEFNYDDLAKFTNTTSDFINNVVDEVLRPLNIATIQQTGGWLDYNMAPSVTRQVLIPKDRIETAFSIIGYLSQQTKIMGFRPNPKGKDMALWFSSESFRDPKVADTFYRTMRERHPDIFQGYSSGEYEGSPALIVYQEVNARGNAEKKKEILDNKIKEVVDLIESDITDYAKTLDNKIDLETQIVDMYSVENNWKENKNGEIYLQRINETLGQEVQDRISGQYREEYKSILDQEIKQKQKAPKAKPQVSYQLKPLDQPLELPDETWLEIFKRKVVNRLSRLEKVTAEIGDVDEQTNAYLAAVLYEGKTEDRIDRFQKYIEDYIKRLKKAGFTVDDIGEYLYARHAEERNAKVKEDDPTFEGTGSGMSREDTTLEDGTVVEGYESILKRFKGTKIERFAREFDRKVIRERLNILKKGGLITQETYDFFTEESPYENYVPLKGTSEKKQGGTGTSGFSIVGKDIKRKRGRNSRADNPFVQALVDYELAIVRAEKNEVSSKFYLFALENPSNLWEVGGRRYLPRYDKNGEVAFFDPMTLQENQVQAFVDGKLKVITINDTGLLNAMKNLGTGTTFRFAQKFNTYLRAIYTSFNPEFLITNFERDIQTALINMQASTDIKVTSKIMKDIMGGAPMRAIYRTRREKGDAKLSINQEKLNEYRKYYAEYKKEGGAMGWVATQSVEDKLNDLKKVIARAQSSRNPKQFFRYLGKWIEDMNMTVEQAVRLATYANLRKSGLSRAEAAKISKELTVNFNQQGEWGSVINTLYLFSNATIQGNYFLFRAFKKSRKVKAASAGIILATVLLNIFNRMNGGDDWEKYSDYEKDFHWLYILPNGNVVKMKVPYGYNIFHVMGNVTEEAIAGKITYDKAFTRVLESILHAASPIGFGEGFSQYVPTVFGLKPMVEIWLNENFMGGKIRPDQPHFGQNKPDSQLYFDSINPDIKAVTTWVNKVAGGSETVSPRGIRRLADVSPETLEHMLDTFTGGTGRFIERSYRTGKQLLQGNVPPLKEIPFVRTFVSEPSKYTMLYKMYDMYEESARTIYTKNEIKEFKKYLSSSVKDGAIENKKAKKIMKTFNENQREARASMK